MEYEMLVTFKEVYRVYVEADDEDAAEELAWQKVNDDSDDVELLSETVDITVDNVYE